MAAPQGVDSFLFVRTLDISGADYQSFRLQDSTGTISAGSGSTLPYSLDNSARTPDFYFLNRPNGSGSIAIDTYAISAEGKLQFADSYADPNIAFRASVASRDGRCLFAYGEVSTPEMRGAGTGYIFAFAIAPSGKLTQVGKPFTAGSFSDGTYAQYVDHMQVSRHGDTLIVRTDSSGPHATHDTAIAAIRILADGSLRSTPIVSTGCYACDWDSSRIVWMSYSSDGRFLAVAGIFADFAPPELRIYSLNSDGVATLRSSLPVATFRGLIVDSRFLYTMTEAGDVRGFDLHQDGTLSPIAGAAQLAQGFLADKSATERHLVITDSALASYRVNDDGTLTAVSTVALKPQSWLESVVPVR